MGKLGDYKKTRASHQWRKDKWLRWKKSQKLLGKSRNINYKAWEYWEPDTESEDEGDPIVPRDNPEFMAMEMDMKERHKKAADKAKTAEKCRQRGNECMKTGDFVGAIEHYDEGLEYKRDNKALWTNKALAELKIFRWHDAVASCNKVIEYTEIFEDGFKKSADPCFKAFTRRAAALRALHRWEEAAEDLEDALRLFPKDREARDLLEKTKAALAESKTVEDLEKAAAAPAEEEVEEVVREGPVRIEIEEESSDEEAPEGGAAAEGATSKHAGSALRSLSQKDYKALLKGLGKDESERVKFCARRGGKNDSIKKEDSRKLDMRQIEEMMDPSKLDELIKDAERAGLLWKKGQGQVVPLRSDVKYLSSATDKDEDDEAASFLRTVVPRVLGVLHVLSSSSDHHCALTAPAVRHVWPLITNNDWRHAVLELLFEWSQRSISAKSMAEFAGRYPDPHLRTLVEIVASDSKENILPPGFEERAKQASERLGGDSGGMDGLDSVFDDMLAGLSKSSAAELAVSALGNICLAGQGLPVFKEQLATFRDELVTALSKQLKPMNWRLCGRAAGAVCNLLRLGDTFAAAVEEKCTKPLVIALRDEVGEGGESSAAPMMKAMREMGAGMNMPGMPSSADGSAVRLINALVNLLTVRQGCAQQLVDLGLLDIGVSLMDFEKAKTCVAARPGSDETPEELTSRAFTLVARLLTRAPGALSLAREAQLVRLLHAALEGGSKPMRAVSKGGDASAADQEAIERLELCVRIVAVLITKTPGGLDRLTERAPRIEEVSDETALGTSSSSSAAPVCFRDLSKRLLDIAGASRPSGHVDPDEASGPASRLRGNLALLFGALCEAQMGDSAPPSLRELDFSPIVETYIDVMRKERGAVQNNIGVFVTKLAQNPRYKQKVRDANGMESLHQIQLPKVEAQKAEAARKHRMVTNSDARAAEITRLKGLKGMD